MVPKVVVHEPTSWGMLTESSIPHRGIVAASTETGMMPSEKRRRADLSEYEFIGVRRRSADRSQFESE